MNGDGEEKMQILLDLTVVPSAAVLAQTMLFELHLQPWHE